MGLFKSAGDSLKRRQLLNKLNDMFKSQYVRGEFQYLLTFKTTITLNGMYLRTTIMNDSGISDSELNEIGSSIISMGMIRREMFAISYVGLQVIGKNEQKGLKWDLEDYDDSLGYISESKINRFIDKIKS